MLPSKAYSWISIPVQVPARVDWRGENVRPVRGRMQFTEVVVPRVIEAARTNNGWTEVLCRYGEYGRRWYPCRKGVS